MIDLIWLVPLLPLIGFLIIGLGRNVLPRPVIGAFGTAVVILSFILSCFLFAEVYQARQLNQDASFTVHLFDWISVGSVNVALSFLLDPLSAIMLLIVTGIGSLIHIYSIGYMKTDPGFGKFSLT